MGRACIAQLFAVLGFVSLIVPHLLGCVAMGKMVFDKIVEKLCTIE